MRSFGSVWQPGFQRERAGRGRLLRPLGRAGSRPRDHLRGERRRAEEVRGRGEPQQTRRPSSSPRHGWGRRRLARPSEAADSGKSGGRNGRWACGTPRRSDAPQCDPCHSKRGSLRCHEQRQQLEAPPVQCYAQTPWRHRCRRKGEGAGLLQRPARFRGDCWRRRERGPETRRAGPASRNQLLRCRGCPRLPWRSARSGPSGAVAYSTLVSGSAASQERFRPVPTRQAGGHQSRLLRQQRR